MVLPLWERAWQFLKKLQIELPYDLAILLLSRHPQEVKAGSPRDVGASIVTAVFLTPANERKQHKCPSTNEWVNKM